MLLLFALGTLHKESWKLKQRLDDWQDMKYYRLFWYDVVSLSLLWSTGTRMTCDSQTERRSMRAKRRKLLSIHETRGMARAQTTSPSLDLVCWDGSILLHPRT